MYSVSWRFDRLLSGEDTDGHCSRKHATKQKNVKSHVFNFEKRAKYVLSNTADHWMDFRLPVSQIHQILSEREAQFLIILNYDATSLTWVEIMISEYF